MQRSEGPGAHSAEARGIAEVEKCSAGNQVSARPEGYSR
jgi:hypothetical protein